MIKKLVLGIAVICMAVFAAYGSTGQTGQQHNLGRVLILYYTWSEHAYTERAARIIQSLTGATMIRVEPLTPFPDLNTRDMITWVGTQRRNQLWPEIRDLGVDPASFDFIFIGTPVWHQTVALPIETLLRETDFGGRPVACFALANNFEGQILNHFARLVRNAQVREGIAFRTITETRLEARLTQWVNNMSRLP